MLYNRQNELLYLIEKVGRVTRTQIQKLAFLSCVNSTSPSFDFIPYNYGPYSVTLQNDLDYLVNQGYLVYANDSYARVGDNKPSVNTKRWNALDEVIENYKDYSATTLMQIIYRKYPSYAANSVKAEELLTLEEMATVKACIPRNEETQIFTIGYEGKSLEKYLYQLYENNIHLLVDVRASSYSMKKEFIGSRLASGCKLLKIDYIHIPELGIPNQYRKDIADKDMLFQFYQSELLSHRTKEIGQVAELLQRHKRIALTCFEALHSDCHRFYLAEKLLAYLDGRVSVEHL